MCRCELGALADRLAERGEDHSTVGSDRHGEACNRAGRWLHEARDPRTERLGRAREADQQVDELVVGDQRVAAAALATLQAQLCAAGAWQAALDVATLELAQVAAGRDRGPRATQRIYGLVANPPPSGTPEKFCF